MSKFETQDNKEQVEYARRVKELEKEFLKDDSAGSKDTISSCEPCQNANIRCLCKVELTNTETKDKWEWKGGSLANTDKTERRFILVSSDKNKGEHEVYFHVLGTCRNDHEACTEVYYKENNSSMKKANSSVSECGGVSGLLSMPSNINHIFNEQNNNQDQVLLVDTLNFIGDIDKSTPILQMERVDKFIFGQTSWKERFSKLPNSIPNLLARTMNFAIFSNISGIPITHYEVYVLECKDNRDISTEFSLERRSYEAGNFARVKANYYVLPQYSVTHDLVIDFQEHKLEGEVVEELGGIKNHIIKGTLDIGKLIEQFARTIRLIKLLNQIIDGAKMIELFEEYLPNSYLKVELEYPILSVQGTARLAYNQKSVIENENPNYYIERIEQIIKADPVIGMSVSFEMLSLLLLAIPQLKILIGKHDYGVIHWHVTLTLKGILVAAGELSIKSSEINDHHSIYPKVSGRGGLELEGKLEFGIRAVIFNAVFGASFRLKGMLEAGLLCPEQGGLGWYFGTTGVALYWKVEIVFGLSGKHDDQNNNKEMDEKSYASFGISPTGEKQPIIWTEELAKLELKNRQDIRGNRIDWRRKRKALRKRVRDYTQQVHEFNRSLSASLSAGYGGRDDIYNYWGQESQLKAAEKELREHNKLEEDVKRMEGIIMSINKIDVNEQKRLIELTEKYKHFGSLSSEENSERLELSDKINGIRSEYDAPYDPREILGAETEVNLRQARIDQVRGILGIGEPSYAPVLSDSDREELEKELSRLEGDTENRGRIVLSKARIIKCSENLTRNDKENIVKAMGQQLSY